jgi:hypothetical protein
VFSGRAVSLHPEDEKILETVRQLADQLNYKLEIQTLTWQDRIGVRRMPPDKVLVLRHKVQLSARAMGRLTPEEWRPILASGLIYQKNLGRWYFRRMLTTMVPMIILLIPALLLDFRYLSGEIVLYDSVLSALIALTLLQGARLLLYLKQMWFRADDQAARVVGKERLISSLTKIGQIQRTEIKDKRGLFHPSIHERIQRLSK